MHRSPIQAKGLLKECIQAPDPVIFCVPIILYRMTEDDTPEENYTIPLRKAEMMRKERYNNYGNLTRTMKMVEKK